MDLFVVVDNADHPAYKSPVSVAHRLAYWEVRSVTVLDKSTGLTANFRQPDDN